MTQALTTRLTNALMAGDAQGHYTYVGTAQRGTLYVVNVKDRRREYDAAGMWAWLQGWQLAGDTPNDTPPQTDTLGEIRTVLRDPHLSDAIRLAIRAAMEDEGIGVVELEQRSGRTRHAITDALRYGKPQTLSTTMAEQLMRALGHGWHVASTKADEAPTLEMPVGGSIEPAAMTRARALMLCHDRGLVTWDSPTDPNRIQRAVTFHASRGGIEHELAASAVRPWLTGIADRVDDEAAALLS